MTTLLIAVVGGAVLLWPFFQAAKAHRSAPPRLTSPEMERLRAMEPRTKAQKIAYVKAIAAEYRRLQAEAQAAPDA